MISFNKLGISVSDYISTYIPNCPESWKEITIHQLLTHSSGIPNFTDFKEFPKIMIKKHTINQTMSIFIDKPLVFPPGKRFSYSNSGYIVLGYIIEQVSNMKYEDYLNENIFDKIGMINTGYDHSDKILKNRAAGYKNNATNNADFVHMSIPHAAGALYSTVEDLYLWDRSLYTEKIVSKESIKSMFTPHIDSYGYGWFIVGSESKSKRVEHSGGINGFSSFIRRYINDDLVLIILSNDEGQAFSVLTNITTIIFRY